MPIFNLLMQSMVEHNQNCTVFFLNLNLICFDKKKFLKVSLERYVNQDDRLNFVPVVYHHFIILALFSMGVEDYANSRGSGEQVTFPSNPQPYTQPPQSDPRQNPNLLRIHADDQDKKTTCLFWSMLFFIVILLAIIAHFAIPSIYVKNNLARSLQGTTLSNCLNPAILNGSKLACSPTQSNPPSLGEVIVGWGPENQFGLLYFQVRPANLSQSIKISQSYQLELYQLKQKDSPANFYISGTPSKLNTTINFDSGTADYIYADDKDTVIGYQYLLAVIIRLEAIPFLELMKFSQNLTLNSTTMRLQSYAINPRYTYYTIILRYVFFAVAIVGCVLYFIRYLKVPQEKKIIEQKMVAVASVLLIMFNDPFYPITVLNPNGASAFFSLFFIVNLIAFLILMWLVIADRILFQDGQIQTAQLTIRKIIYCTFVWLLLMICLMAYTMQQVSGNPFAPDDFKARYMVARIIIGFVVFGGILYISIRFIKSCMAPEGRTWRSNLFMAFSSVFIFAVFIMVISNAFILYNYSGSTILVAYSLINIYIFYLQYMYSITREEAEKLTHPEMDQQMQQQNNYDVVTVGTIDLVDVNLDDQDDRFPRLQENKKSQNGLGVDEEVKKQEMHQLEDSQFN